MQSFLQIFLGSLVLSLIHASIPNHWLPLVAIGRTEKWSRRETVGVTAIAGLAHTLSTIIIGILIGIIGYKLSESNKFITGIAAPIILIVLGIIYLSIEIRHNITHTQLHHDHPELRPDLKRKSKTAIVGSLAVGMFFSPCIEIEAYFFVASSLGWVGIITVSSVYVFITVTGMMTLVYLAGRGLEKLEWHFMEHHEKLIAGLVLIILGLVGYFFRF